jgi:hypothetical protein
VEVKVSNAVMPVEAGVLWVEHTRAEEMGKAKSKVEEEKVGADIR